jgi:hypothetical protein
MLRLQFLLKSNLTLVKAAESIDFVLVFSPDLHFFPANRDLILLRQLLL